VKIRSSTAHDDFEITVISLIDVLLTLLMFFVMTTTFVHQSQLKVNLPEASDTKVSVDKEPITLVIDRNGRYFIGNNEVLQSGLASLKEGILQAVGSDQSRTAPVILRADAMASHQAVVTAMDALGQLGFTHLSIATTTSKDDKTK